MADQKKDEELTGSFSSTKDYGVLLRGEEGYRRVLVSSGDFEDKTGVLSRDPNRLLVVLISVPYNRE